MPGDMCKRSFQFGLSPAHLLNSCSMKVLLVILLLLLALLQYRLWFGDGGVIDMQHMQQAVDAQQLQIEALKERNEALAAEVKDLKQGVAAIEERARSELGMIKKDETFYQVVEE